MSKVNHSNNFLENNKNPNRILIVLLHNWIQERWDKLVRKIVFRSRKKDHKDTSEISHQWNKRYDYQESHWLKSQERVDSGCKPLTYNWWCTRFIQKLN